MYFFLACHLTITVTGWILGRILSRCCHEVVTEHIEHPCNAALYWSPGHVDDDGGGDGRQGIEEEQARPPPLKHPHSVFGGVANRLVNIWRIKFNFFYQICLEVSYALVSDTDSLTRTFIRLWVLTYKVLVYSQAVSQGYS